MQFFSFRWTNDVKIRNKLILSFVLVVIVPVIMVGFFLTRELRLMTLHNAIGQASNDIERVAKRTGQILNVPSNISYQLLNDNRLSETATTRYTSRYAVVQAYKNYSALRKYTRLYNAVAGIRFYMDNPTLLNNWEFFQLTPAIAQKPWYRNAVNSHEWIHWDYIEDERDHQNYLSLIRRINFVDKATYGVLVIDVSGKVLNSALSQEEFETMIVDDHNQIVASNRQSFIGKTLSQLKLNRISKSAKSGVYDEQVDGKASKIFIQSITPQDSLNGLRVISVFSIRDIVKNANRILIFSLIVIMISLGVALIMIYGISRLLTNRILRLSRHISKVAIGNLDSPIFIDGKDEIGLLFRQFNLMTRNLMQLMNEVEETHIRNHQLELKQNEIRFKMMASQINPHFLFNVLESIRMKAHMKGEREIAAVVKALGKMMRKRLEAGDDKIPLREELEMVRRYLEIQRFRYEERLNYEIIVDPDLLNIPVPPLIIQPLVENAVLHGLEAKENGGKVTVNVDRDGKELKIQVLDNGIGMRESKLQEICKSLGEEEGANRIGLRNVHSRLVLSYGEEHGLNIRSDPDGGTAIRFSIPMGGEGDV